jgi:hypothetical protein
MCRMNATCPICPCPPVCCCRGSPLIWTCPLQAELSAAFDEYRRTQFGGWPWPEDAPVFPRTQGRFAARGKDTPIELPPASSGAKGDGKTEL